LSFLHPPAPSDLPSFPTRRSSDLCTRSRAVSLGASSSSYDTRVFDARIGHVKANRLRTSPSPIVVSHDRPSGGMMQVSPPNLNRSEEHTSELQSRFDLVCRLLLEK